MYKVGDRVRIVNYRTEGMNDDGEMDKWLGKVMTIRRVNKHLDNPYKMEEDRDEYVGYGWFWGDEMISGLADTLTIEIDPTDRAAAHKAVEDAIAEYQRRDYEWTKAEIEEATRLSDEMILDLHHKRLNPVFYHAAGEVRLKFGFFEPSGDCNYIAAVPKGAPYSAEIGRCVCLCKATGRKIPAFIRNKNRGRKK